MTRIPSTAGERRSGAARPAITLSGRLAALEQCRTDRELCDWLADFARRLEFDDAYYAHIGHIPGVRQTAPTWQPLRFLATGTPDQRGDCIDQVRRCVDLRAYFMPFAHSVRRSNTASPGKDGARGKCHTGRWRSEVVVPIQDYSAGPALLGLLGRSLPDAEIILRRRRYALAVVGIAFHVQACALIRIPRTPPKPTLSDREMICLRLMALGRSLHSIAATLGVTPAAVDRHLARAARKLSATGHTQAVALALTSGLIRI